MDLKEYRPSVAAIYISVRNLAALFFDSHQLQRIRRLGNSGALRSSSRRVPKATPHFPELLPIPPIVAYLVKNVSGACSADR